MDTEILTAVAQLNMANDRASVYAGGERAPASMWSIRRACPAYSDRQIRVAVKALVANGALVAESCANGGLATNYLCNAENK